MPVKLYSPSDQVCRAGAGTVASSDSIERRIAIPCWLSDWEEAADHDASAQLKGMKPSSTVKGKCVIQLSV